MQKVGAMEKGEPEIGGTGKLEEKQKEIEAKNEQIKNLQQQLTKMRKRLEENQRQEQWQQVRRTKQRRSEIDSENTNRGRIPLGNRFAALG